MALTIANGSEIIFYNWTVLCQMAQHNSKDYCEKGLIFLFVFGLLLQGEGMYLKKPSERTALVYAF